MDSDEPPLWRGQEACSPVIAVAVHAGHALRAEIAALTVLDDSSRLREEDPYTDGFATLSTTYLVAGRSRFEVDLNRDRANAVYLTPDQSWGLDLWKHPLNEEVLARSLAVYDAFYAMLGGVLDRAVAAFGRFVVYDLHSYNHRRDGADSPAADPARNPDINLGTGSMDRARWAPLVDRFLEDLHTAQLLSRPHLNVGENVRFRGGHLAQWVHQRYPQTGCALAVEVKKFFMDEHTGALDERVFADVGNALAGTVPGVLAELERAAG
ncbi:MAG: N-formylglutamate amidohydrolase [Sporichthyaceae bacterium]